MAMRLPNGNKATNASENMEVFGPHFHNVFNNHRPMDPTVLEHVPQYNDVPCCFNQNLFWREPLRAARGAVVGLWGGNYPYTP
jgi:hypothetical protein